MSYLINQLQCRSQVLEKFPCESMLAGIIGDRPGSSRLNHLQSDTYWYGDALRWHDPGSSRLNHLQSDTINATRNGA